MMLDMVADTLLCIEWHTDPTVAEEPTDAHRKFMERARKVWTLRTCLWRVSYGSRHSR